MEKDFITESIQDIIEYIKVKIARKEFEFIEADAYCAALRIDTSHIVDIWIANGMNCCRIYAIDKMRMNESLSDGYAKALWNSVNPFLAKHALIQEIKQKQEQIESLNKTLLKLETGTGEDNGG